jgi:hypothetical protein
MAEQLTLKDSVRTWLKHPVGGPIVRDLMAQAGVDERMLTPVKFFSVERVLGMAGDAVPQSMVDDVLRRANAG